MVAGHQARVQGWQEHRGIAVDVQPRAGQHLQPFPQSIGRRAIVRQSDLGGRPQLGYPPSRVLRGIGQRGILSRTVGEAGAFQCPVRQQVTGKFALVQARRLQPSREQQHQLAAVNREIMFLAGGKRLAGEAFDSTPVHGAAQHLQPRRAGVGEFVAVTESLWPDSAEEEGVQRVELVVPLRPVFVLLGHPQRAVAERVGAGQADLARGIQPEKPRQRGFRSGPRVIRLAGTRPRPVTGRRGASLPAVLPTTPSAFAHRQPLTLGSSEVTAAIA